MGEVICYMLSDKTKTINNLLPVDVHVSAIVLLHWDTMTQSQ